MIQWGIESNLHVLFKIRAEKFAFLRMVGGFSFPDTYPLD